MKNIIIGILLFLVNLAFSQNQEIYMKLDKNSLSVEKGEISNLKFPFTVLFKEADFKLKEIKWKNGKDVIPGSNKKFGIDIKTGEHDNGYYKIIFEVNEKKVVCNTLGDTSLPNNSVSIEIEGKSYSFEYSDISKKGKDKDESDDEYQAGYMYYDALELASEDTKPLIKLKILNSYKYSDAIENPYLKKIYHIADSLANARTTDPSGSLINSIGNTDVTYFAAGLARFLAERAKEELNEAFFRKMKDKIKEYPELKKVFPTTHAFLNTIETYSYSSMIQVLKEAFETDVQNLPENLYEIKNLTRADCDESLDGKLVNCQVRMDRLQNFLTQKVAGRWVVLGMYTVKEAVQSTNPADLIQNISASDDLLAVKQISKDNSDFSSYNLASTIELSNLISQSLISKDEKKVWVTTAELNTLLKTPNGIEAYLGLLLATEQIKEDENKIRFYKSSSQELKLEEILTTGADKIDQLKTLIKNIHTGFNSANNAVAKMMLASEKSVETDVQSLYNYYRVFTTSLKPIVQNKFVKDNICDFSSELSKIEQYLNPAVDIAYHLATKKYSAAVYDATQLLNNKKEPAFEKPVAQSMIKYGTLISTVANAQSSDEVKKAIEASVLPAGSSAIKRNSNWSVSINAYVGAYYGKVYTHEQKYVYDTSNTIVDSTRVQKSYKTFGLYAPVGVSLNKGSKSGWGLSLSAQVIDLGALVNFYLKEGDQTALPSDFKVRLSNIFAPGVQLGINIPKTPLTLMGGIQYVPALYETSQIKSKPEITASDAYRVHLGLVVDIPLWNLKVWDFNK